VKYCISVVLKRYENQSPRFSLQVRNELVKGA